MKTPRNIVVNYQGKDFNVAYPNVGQRIKIEQIKMMLSQNTYGDMVRSGHLTAIELLDVIDAAAYVSVLIPAINLDYEKFTNLDVDESTELIMLYKNEIYPWMSKIETEARNYDKEMIEKKKKIDSYKETHKEE